VSQDSTLHHSTGAQEVLIEWQEVIIDWQEVLIDWQELLIYYHRMFPKTQLSTTVQAVRRCL
jgi:hypothetical protein